MQEWTMAHPYLTFTLALFVIVLVNNLVVGIVNSRQNDDDIDEKDVKNEDDKKV
jgi:hypothetical protein